MLNPDTRVHPLWADRMAAHFNDKPNVGAVGPVSTNCLSTQSYYAIYGAHAKEEDMCEQVLRNSTSYVKAKLLIGFCLMTRRGIMNKIGKLDPNCFLGNDDLEYSLRLRMHGYELIVAKDAFIAHDMQKSFASVPKETTSKLVQESTDYLYRKLFKVFDGKIPSPEELWGINWFKPSQELIDDLSRANT